MVWESLMKIMSPSLSFVVGGTMTMLTLTEAPSSRAPGRRRRSRGRARNRASSFRSECSNVEVTARASVGKHVGELGDGGAS